MLRQSDVDRVEQAAKDNIVDLVGSVVPLKREGGSWKGCCPFHGEKTPSFKVNVKGGFCKCFGCNWGGSPIQFWMQFQNMTFPDAIKDLATRYGISIVTDEVAEARRIGMGTYLQKQREAAEVVRRAKYERGKAKPEKPSGFFLNVPPYHEIKRGEKIPTIVTTYLRQRNVPLELAERYRFGYVMRHVMRLVDVHGKPMRDKEGRPMEQSFVNRLILPVFFQGKLVYFQARTMDGDKRKFINPRETLKTLPVFGAEEAGAAGTAINSEGIFDAIAGTETALDLGRTFRGVTCFGKFPSLEQMKFLYDLGVRSWVTLLDPTVEVREIVQATLQARQVFDHVRVALLQGEKDPWQSWMEDGPAAIDQAIRNSTQLGAYIRNLKLQGVKVETDSEVYSRRA